MGRSSPSFFVQDCAYSTYYHTVEADGYGNGRDFDADDEASIRAYARLIEARNSGCWKHEGFSVSADEDDDDESSTRYHFLEYSGMYTSYQHDTTYCQLYYELVLHVLLLIKAHVNSQKTLREYVSCLVGIRYQVSTSYTNNGRVQPFRFGLYGSVCET